MFYKCSGLTSLNVTSFNTEKVTGDGVSNMFRECSGLTVLDVSSFNISNASYADLMFAYCRQLTTIYASDTFGASGVKRGNRMFIDCPKLVGGNGTTYALSNTGLSYACIDSVEQKGYFTDIRQKP